MSLRPHPAGDEGGPKGLARRGCVGRLATPAAAPAAAPTKEGRSNAAPRSNRESLTSSCERIVS